jgi:hypothetical protein
MGLKAYCICHVASLTRYKRSVFSSYLTSRTWQNSLHKSEWGHNSNPSQNLRLDLQVQVGRLDPQSPSGISKWHSLSRYIPNTVSRCGRVPSLSMMALATSPRRTTNPSIREYPTSISINWWGTPPPLHRSYQLKETACHISTCVQNQ